MYYHKYLHQIGAKDQKYPILASLVKQNTLKNRKSFKIDETEMYSVVVVNRIHLQ